MQHGKALQAPAGGALFGRIRKILLRPLWLPKFLYEVLPYLYIVCGIAALASAIYTPDWTWILPWAALVGLICLHAGLGVATLRYRMRQRRKPPADRDPSTGN